MNRQERRHPQGQSKLAEGKPKNMLVTAGGMVSGHTLNPECVGQATAWREKRVSELKAHIKKHRLDINAIHELSRLTSYAETMKYLESLN